MNKAMQNDIGAFLVAREAAYPRTIHDGTGGEDGVEINGEPINFEGFSGGARPHSAKVVINYRLVCGPGGTATIKSNFQDSASSASGFADYDDKDGSTANNAAIGDAGSTATQTVYGVMTYDLDLNAAKKFGRVQLTPTVNGTTAATDNLDLSAVVVFGGFDVVPPS